MFLRLRSQGSWVQGAFYAAALLLRRSVGCALAARCGLPAAVLNTFPRRKDASALLLCLTVSLYLQQRLPIVGLEKKLRGTY